MDTSEFPRPLQFKTEVIDFIPVIRFHMLARNETKGGPNGPPFILLERKHLQ